MASPSVLETMEQTGGRPGDPCVMVIFGAGGDLTRRKLFPALYNLATDNLLSREFAVVGLAREPMNTEQFRDKFREDIKQFATGALSDDSDRVVREEAVLPIRGVRRRRLRTPSCGSAAASRQGTRHAGKLLLLSGDGARVLRADRRSS